MYRRLVMNQSLNRSYSVTCNQTVTPVTRTPVQRSLSYNATSDSGESYFSISSIRNVQRNTKQIKCCLLDAKAQIDKFVKEYPLNWDLSDTSIVRRYCDAERRLPCIATRLDKCKFESLLMVKSLLKNMENNLLKSLKPSAKNEKLLAAYLARAEHSTGNAMAVCVNICFGKFELKDLFLSNDIMSAAMVIQQYFANVINEVGK